MVKRLAVNMPYPDTDGIKRDEKIARIISPAYASLSGELNAVMQYVYHYFNFKISDDADNADVMLGIALAEMNHLEKLGELLITLGVDPVYTAYPPYKTDFYSARGVSYSKTAVKMLLDDIAGELAAINEYQKILDKIPKTDNGERVGAIIYRIIIDEELHVKILKDALKKIKPQISL